MRARTTSTRNNHRGPVSERLSIKHILKRRKKTVKNWLDELGLTTYASALMWCDKVGVKCITEEEFVKETGSLIPLVNDPSEGVVVITLKPIEEELPDPQEPEEDKRPSRKRGRKHSLDESTGEPTTGSSET